MYAIVLRRCISILRHSFELYDAEPELWIESDEFFLLPNALSGFYTDEIYQEKDWEIRLFMLTERTL